MRECTVFPLHLKSCTCKVFSNYIATAAVAKPAAAIATAAIAIAAALAAAVQASLRDAD